jgi:Na+(H+)/acetate symporter ActP
LSTAELKTIKSNSRRLLQLITQMLTLGKPDAGMLRLPHILDRFYQAPSAEVGRGQRQASAWR